MRFADIPGNRTVKEALVRMADSGRIPHAVMFHENEGCGGLAMALAFMQYLNCSSRQAGDSCGKCQECHQTDKLIYPDLHYVFPVANRKSGEKTTSGMLAAEWRKLVAGNPFFMENELYGALGIEKKSAAISVADAKDILNYLSLSSFSDGYRAIIVWLPEKMNNEASNRLLKIVEEPSDKTLFLFITHNPELVMQTIRSRCQLIRICPATGEEIAAALPKWTGTDGETVMYAADFSGGSIGMAIRSLADKDENVQMMDIFMRLMDAGLGGNYLAALEAGETIAALDSREKQKSFCKFAGNCVRKIYMLQQNMGGIAGIRPEEKDFFDDAARRCSKSFCKRSLAALSRANMLVSRNVNQKIIFTNLVGRMFV